MTIRGNSMPICSSGTSAFLLYRKMDQRTFQLNTAHDGVQRSADRREAGDDTSLPSGPQGGDNE